MSDTFSPLSNAAPQFLISKGRLQVIDASAVLHDLGPAQTSMQAMADFLAAHDFEDRPALKTLTLDEAGDRFGRAIIYIANTARL